MRWKQFFTPVQSFDAEQAPKYEEQAHLKLLAFFIKDRIDRKFMKKFQALE